MKRLAGIKGSFRFRLSAIVAGLALLLVGALALSNAYAINVIRSRVQRMNQQNLFMYLRQVQYSFADAETYLAGLNFSNPNIQMLENPSSQLDWSLAVTKQQAELVKALPAFSNIHGLFVYSAPTDVWLDAFAPGLPNGERLLVRDHMVEWLAGGGSLEGGNGAGWFARDFDGEYYFFRTLRFRDTYVGAWTSVSALLEPLYVHGDQASERYFFCDSLGIPYNRELAAAGVAAQPDGTLQHLRMEDGNRYLLIMEPSGFGQHYLVAMVRDNSVLEGLGEFQAVIFAIIALVVVYLALLVVFMRRWVMAPLRQLTQNMNALREGDFSARISDSHPYDEFIEVNQAFNEMITRIECLKIDVYEEQLAKQKNRLLYLQQQVAPHMFINCLNTIYGLAGTRRTDLIQKLALDLSKHLRYTLADAPLVPLQREAEHVENYVELTAIRFLDAVQCTVAISPGVASALVPPLLLQTFVENTVKHEVEIGKVVHVYVDAQVGGGGALEILVWDTGRGFPAPVLESLGEQDFGQSDRGERIGLSNITQRLLLLYGRENVRVHFSNREGAGAQIRIEIPLLREEDQPL